MKGFCHQKLNQPLRTGPVKLAPKKYNIKTAKLYLFPFFCIYGIQGSLPTISAPITLDFPDY